MAAWKNYDLATGLAVGDNIKEDVFQVISNISPTETPFQSMIKQGTANSTLHEWLTDILGVEPGASVAANRRVEGDTATEATLRAADRLNNYTQIQSREVNVSATVASTDIHGRASDPAYQLLKQLKDLKNEAEIWLCGESNKKEVGDATTAREAASLSSWIATNDSFGSGGVSPSGDGTDIRTDGTQRSFTENQLKDVAQDVYNSGGKADYLMLGLYNKRAFSGFDGVATKFKDAEDKRTIGATDIYVSDWGEIMAVPNRFQLARDAYLLDSGLWSMDYLRTTKQTPLAKVGDADRTFVVSEWTLSALNEKGNGSINDLLTS